MTRVYIGLGTNIDRERYLRIGLDNLREAFGELMLSTVYETVAVGFAGDNFYNMVIGVDTDLTPVEVYQTLRRIETAHGRQRQQPRYSARTLDLDLLLYDDQVLKTPEFEIPRYDIDEYPFVLAPLAELDGDRRHPLKGKTYAELWAAYDKTDLEMWPLQIELNPA
ncbi:MAG: 2-amino-4-hydroxy-6-hydroxymethyldihydropteridine diphosphokinase [Gammaproteobacteria bacterium]